MSGGRYVRVLGEKVADRLRLLSADQERHNLDEEVDLARLLALDAVKLYDAAQGEGVKDDTKAMAAQVLRQAINDVASIVQTSIKVKTQSRELVNLENFRFIMNQVERVIVGHLGTEEGDKLIRQIASHVRFQPELEVRID